jgi:uncharacterized membrane protein
MRTLLRMNNVAPSVAAPSFSPPAQATLHAVTATQADKGPVRHRWERLGTAGLLTFALLPGLAGLVRVYVIAADADPAGLGLRAIPSPAPIVLHIFAVIAYGGLGALQLVRGFRRRHPRLHRRLGAVVLAAGLVAAGTGLWMSVLWPPGPADGAALYVTRVLVGGGMLIALVLATTSLLRRDFRVHGAHMMRAWALGVGASTQLLTGLPVVLLVGELSVGGRAAQMGLSWLLNIAVAEIVITRRRRSLKR